MTRTCSPQPDSGSADEGRAEVHGPGLDLNELANVAKRLTVDVNGRRRPSRLRPVEHPPVRLRHAWINDLRRLGTAWGAGSYVAADGKTAQIPAVWQQAWQWVLRRHVAVPFARPTRSE